MLSQTSKVILGIIEDHLVNGDEKGRKEYGVSIDEADDFVYNWQLEAMAEMADALKYQQKEIGKLKTENIRLKTQPRFKMEEENLKLASEINVKNKIIGQMKKANESLHNENSVLSANYEELENRHNDLIKHAKDLLIHLEGKKVNK